MHHKKLKANIATYIEKKGLINDGARLIIGLSGGPDSVFLLHFLASLREEKKLTLIAAHLDHGWRPESANDAQFCKELASNYNIPFIGKTITDLQLSLKFNGSQEEIGRKARRAFFESVAKEHNATAITLAHHADDQMETFFIRMMRGASLSGLVGMKAQEGLYIRPLLETKKAVILAYLHENKITYLLDGSNQSDSYLRNRIRNTAIPGLQQVDARFDHNFNATHAHLAQTEEFLQELAQQTVRTICNESGSLAVDKLLALHPVIRHRVLINWLVAHRVPFTPSQGLLDEIIRFLEKPGDGQHIFYGKWTINKNSNSASIILIRS